MIEKQILQKGEGFIRFIWPWPSTQSRRGWSSRWALTVVAGAMYWHQITAQRMQKSWRQSLPASPVTRRSRMYSSVVNLMEEQTIWQSCMITTSFPFYYKVQAPWSEKHKVSNSIWSNGFLLTHISLRCPLIYASLPHRAQNSIRVI